MIPLPFLKHEFEGIGEASTAMLFAGLTASGNPALLVLTKGVQGKLLFLLMKVFFMTSANFGLIFLNVGAEKIKVMVAEDDFIDSYNDANKLIAKIRALGRDLTDEEAAAIDEPVKDAFRKFARFGRKQKKEKKQDD